MATREARQFSQKRDLDNLCADRMARGVALFTPTLNDIERLFLSASQDIEGLAPIDRIMEIFKHNPDTMMSLSRNHPVRGWQNPEAFVAQLPLTQEGLDALFSGDLDTAMPDVKYICRQHEAPAAVYVWCIYVNPKTAGGIALVMQRLSTPLYRQATLYCKAANTKAYGFFKSLGFTHGATYKNWHQPDLLEFKRKTVVQTPNPFNDEPPLYDTAVFPPKTKKEIGIRVVHSINDYQKIVAVRSATYLVEHDCPYDEEFDGNDFACTHLLGYVGGEPAGCIRVRFFASFAKIERLAVIPRFRRSLLADRLIRSAIELTKKKGYRQLYGHAEPELVKLWARYGFVPRTDKPDYSFSDRDYLEGDLYLDLINDPITNSCPPHVINRPEGQWHRPGVLEREAIK